MQESKHWYSSSSTACNWGGKPFTTNIRVEGVLLHVSNHFLKQIHKWPKIGNKTSPWNLFFLIQLLSLGGGKPLAENLSSKTIPVDLTQKSFWKDEPIKPPVHWKDCTTCTWHSTGLWFVEAWCAAPSPLQVIFYWHALLGAANRKRIIL